MQHYPLVRIGCNALSRGREFNNSALSSRSIKWNWLINNEEYIYKDLSIKSIKCTDSEFDDNPEITAYIQVRDLTNKNKNLIPMK